MLSGALPFNALNTMRFSLFIMHCLTGTSAVSLDKVLQSRPSSNSSRIVIKGFAL